jgi:DNA-directed RNA polymerase subunit RPC12/RpoP
MKRRNSNGGDTRRCPRCETRTHHSELLGPLKSDPKHPEDRRFDFRHVTYRCAICGHQERCEQLPNLLVEFFHT